MVSDDSKRSLPKPKKHFGQVFLTDPSVAEFVVGFTKSLKPEEVLEIGPGPGALTERLLTCGLPLTVVEKDRDMITGLKKIQENNSNLNIVQDDFLKFDLQSWAKGSKRVVVGNIPYNISTPIVMTLLREINHLSGCMLLTQKEFAQRIAAVPHTKQYGSLSVFTQLRGRLSLELDVPRTSFKPVPKVDSALVSIQPHSETYPPELLVVVEKITKQAFSQRRKKVSNALKTLLPDDFDWNVDQTLRPENISPLEYLELARRYLQSSSKASSGE